MRRIQVLSVYEAKQFDQPPKFNKAERDSFFSLSSVVKAKVDNAQGDVNPVGIVLQYGYFKATGKFYVSSKFRNNDINHVTKKLGFKTISNFHEHYSEKSRNNHKVAILKTLGYQSFNQEKDLFKSIIVDLVAKQMLPRKIVFSVVDLFNARKIEVPSYDTFSKEITAQYNRFENALVERLSVIITDPEKKALNQLIEKSNDGFQRPLLVRLKTINQSIKPGQIKKSIHGFLIIKRFRSELSTLIKGLGMSSEAIRYYAQWVIKAKATQITDIVDDNKRFLFLTTFVAHQFKIWQDTLMEVMLKSVQHYTNKAELMVNAINTENLTKKNQLTSSVLQVYREHNVSVKAVRSVLYNKSYTDTEKISCLYKIVPEIESNIEVQAEEAAHQLLEKIEKDNDNQQFYQALETLSRKLQNRVADIIKHLGFSRHDTLINLGNALQHYQSNAHLTKNAPSTFLNAAEYKLIFQENNFNSLLYKAIFFIRITEAVKSGAISLSESYKYMPIESYLMDKEKWQTERNAILKKTGLLEFEDIDQLLCDLEKRLDSRFYTVNKRILSGENSYVKIKKDGGFTVHTPAIEKPDYDSILDLLGRDHYISMLQMMAEINTDTQFTTCFKHFKIRGGQSPPSDATFFAGIFALGTNIGLHKLANSARGINYNTLLHAVEWRFSLENLYAVNDVLTERMNQMWLPSQFKKEKEFLHTSSDAQKRSVTAESLNANCSYKYFGNGKGANIYMFIDERGILFYSSVFSSSERDAAHVIDGLLHNENFESSMHSTDTHGYSEIVFAVSHLLRTSFAPRIKDIADVALISFEKIVGDLEAKGYPIKPSQYAEQKAIKSNWDYILRLVATIKLREHKASTVLKRLSSYAKQHFLLSGIKAFGRIIKSIFILNYIDDVELRQTIEKQLNKGELANRFSSAITFVNNQEIVQSLQEDQEIAAMCKLILQNIIILWNYTNLTKLIMRSDSERQIEILLNITQGSIIAWGHANLLGLYDFRDLTSKNDDEFSDKEVMEFRLSEGWK